MYFFGLANVAILLGALLLAPVGVFCIWLAFAI